jgi:carboxylesterase type B
MLYPNKKLQDVLFLDSRFQPGSKTMLAMKLERTKALVYNYMFTYEYQVNGGVTAFLCSEIAFAFHALGEPHIRIATGGAPTALALQDKVSQAWVNFARTGMRSPGACLLRRGMPTIFFLHLGKFQPAKVGIFQPAETGEYSTGVDNL